MTKSHRYSLLKWCWRLVGPYLPGVLVKRVRLFARAALGLPPSVGVLPPRVGVPDDVGLQLDAILRELRRLHLRLDELEARREPVPGAWPASSWERPGDAA
jgi:hypothetical protein